ncbi:MAG: MtnX-like HAD-IB family phosphatase [bacterium]
MKIFCDFDGTAARNDVGNLLFRTFADERCFDIVNAWKQGQISSQQCLVQECQITTVTRSELAQFAEQQQLDPYFEDFVHFCREKGIEVEILSDGLDFYIERILKKHGLISLVAYRSNHLEFVNHNQIKPEFPYFDNSCGRCANCKGFHVREAKKSHQQVIYVGDGLSDRCGAREADLVFAKRDLLKYCQQNAIPCFEFHAFDDVLRKLKSIVSPAR